MRFVRCKTLAGELRGTVIAQELGVPCSTEYQPDTWVVFVKSFDGIEQAKADGCLVAFDPVDLYVYNDGRDRQSKWPEVDLVLVPSKAAAPFYKQIFPKADFLVVPHQWDSRIDQYAPQDVFRPGYVGRRFNLHEELAIEKVTEPEDQLAALSRFNCHVSEHQTKDSAYLKPATKVACAAAVGANVVTHRSAGALELLGKDYPFYAKSTLFDALFKAKKAFPTQAWIDGLTIMAQVRERTSLKAVAELYRVLM